jgi:hypothetical protein
LELDVHLQKHGIHLDPLRKLISQPRAGAPFI